VEADVYVWHYALLLVHARKEERLSSLGHWLHIVTALPRSTHPPPSIVFGLRIIINGDGERG